MRPEWVVDASVGIKLFVDEELSEEATILFDGLLQEPPVHLYIPDLFYPECANILWKYVRRYNFSADEARDSIRTLLSLSLRPISSSLFLSDALNLALDREVSAYDACYVALADNLGIPLVTADNKLVRKLDGCGVDVHWLGEPGLI
ncbi:MAG TPA: type II toxin-antitoxin system VapC family toxin [Thermoanaerobaculia bacterium]|nr:type II toxin-antitoxin system VapC family toxin [Thermoanaerobaculia bacterium]